MKYKSVVATKRGGPEVLQIVENETRTPAAGEVQIKKSLPRGSGAPMSLPLWLLAFFAKSAFVPGYEIVGVVDALGADVTRVGSGQCVAALTGHGGYT